MSLITFFRKKPMLPCPYLVTKPQFCQYYSILWAKKVKKIPFLPIFTEKSLLSCPWFVKKRPFSKKHVALMPLFFQKNVHSLKNILLSYHFFFSNFLRKIPFCRAHIWSKKCHFCKTSLYYRQKKLNSIPYIPICMKKSVLSCPYFVKNVHSLKNTMLSCHFFKFEMKTPCCFAHIWSKNYQLYQNYTRL